MQSYNTVELAETITDRGNGTRFRFKTNLVSEEGEHALYKKGKNIALSIWPNASTKQDDPVVFEYMTNHWLPMLKDEKDVKLVRAKVGDRDLNMYCMIDNIQKGLDILASNAEYPIPEYIVSELKKQFEIANTEKASMNKTSPRSIPERSRKSDPQKPTEE